MGFWHLLMSDILNFLCRTQPLKGAKRRSLKEIRTIYLSLFTFNF